MTFNYMIPVSISMVLTTIVSVSGAREISLQLSKLEANTSLESLLRNEADKVPNKEVSELKSFRNCFRTICIVQTSYAVVWFALVIALENLNYNNVMPFVYAITSAFLVSTET